MLAELTHEKSLLHSEQCFGIVFENVDENSRFPKNFKYNVRHSGKFGADLYKTKEDSKYPIRFQFNMFKKIQMCVDRGYTQQVLIEKKISLDHLKKVNVRESTI